MLQLHYDSIFMKQNEVIENLVREVEELKRQVAAKPQQIEVEVVPTKNSMTKLRDAIMGVFR